MITEDVQRIMSSLTNFYRDHLPMDSTVMKLLDIYAKTIGIVRDEMERVYDSTFIEHAPLMRTIPYFKLDVQNGWYPNDVASSLSTQTTDQQVIALKRLGYVVPLNYTILNSVPGVVYDITLRLNFNSSISLVADTDYALRDGALYLLPKLIINQRASLRYLHAFDVMVNDYTLERNFGTPLQVYTGTLIPRYEYRDVLSGFDRAWSSQLTIRDLKESIQRVTGWQTFNLQDRLSPDLAIGKKRLYDRYVLSPLTFIVGIPEAIIYDKVRIHTLQYLLDQAKQAQTNYVMFYEIDRIDELSKAEDALAELIKIRETEYSPAKDVIVPKVRYAVSDFMFVNENFNDYDDQILYDSSYDWDTGVKISYDDQQAFDEDRFDQLVVPPSDQVNINVVSFPEIPRNFLGVRDNNEVMITVRANTDGTNSFEVYRSDQEAGPFTFVASAENTLGSTEIEIIFNETSTNNHYYKVRAIAGGRTSLWTLPINI